MTLDNYSALFERVYNISTASFDSNAFGIFEFMKLAVPLVADLEDAVTYDLIAPPEILKPEGLLDAVWDGIAKKYIEDFRSATQAAINAEYALTGNGGANGVSWIRIYPTSLIRDYATVLSRALIEELETSISN